MCHYLDCENVKQKDSKIYLFYLTYLYKNYTMTKLICSFMIVLCLAEQRTQNESKWIPTTNNTSKSDSEHYTLHYCRGLHKVLFDLCLSQTVLRGDRVGWLANAAELVCPLSCSGCEHVAGAVGGRCSQPWWDSVWCLSAHMHLWGRDFNI